MAMSLLRRWSAAGRIPVYAAIGRNMRHEVEDLFLLPTLRRVETPRAADVLLVAGALRQEDGDALRRLHEQLPHPRATFWWRSTPLERHPSASASASAQADGDGDGQDVARCLTALHERLLAAALPPGRDGLLDEQPAISQVHARHGLGGARMNDGRPHGRPMATIADDLRDGLQLDAFTITLGPFAPMLPPGLVLELTLQGDVIQQAAVRQSPYEQPAPATPAGFLRCAARMLELLELQALAQRCRRAAREPAATAASVARAVRWSGALAAVPPGLGRVEALHTDARERLRGWLSGTGVSLDSAQVPLHELLPGLEWQEAMLAIASLDGARFTLSPPDENGSGDGSTPAPTHQVHGHAHHARAMQHGPGGHG